MPTACPRGCARRRSGRARDRRDVRLHRRVPDTRPARDPRGGRRRGAPPARAELGRGVPAGPARRRAALPRPAASLPRAQLLPAARDAVRAQPRVERPRDARAEPRPLRGGARPRGRGRRPGAAPAFPYEEAYAIFVESVRHLAAYGAGRGVRFLVENNVVAPFNLARGGNRWLLMAEAGELLRLARDVASANLGFLVDVGHVNVSARSLGFDRRAFVEAVAGHVAAFHLSDNDGAADDNRPFDTAAWFVPLLREFPGAAVVIEAYRLELAQIRACAAVVEAARAR
ncbi:MAG: TIM barrel protein [Candidatus Rokubacteria bacterium]|nr:TIM barrel protein [Candidatus Rokubacteria bacterium]